MIEKVNPKHPDKIADRIAGAIVDLAYTKNRNPKVAVEVLTGHGHCYVIIETSEDISYKEVEQIKNRILAPEVILHLQVVKQDRRLARNQEKKTRCGDNGIFRGSPLTSEQIELSEIARRIYKEFESDGKYILSGRELIVCQSNCTQEEFEEKMQYSGSYDVRLNPLGFWTGGIDVDSGATNRKLGSDMADGVTGGGLHGKDLSKADVSVNIYAFLKAQKTEKPVELYCAIGDEKVDGKPYEEIVEEAREYIEAMGGFEKFAEWGLF